MHDCMCVVLVCLLMGEGPVYSVFGCGRACTPRVMRHACGETVGAAGPARFWRVYCAECVLLAAGVNGVLCAVRWSLPSHRRVLTVWFFPYVLRSSCTR